MITGVYAALLALLICALAFNVIKARRKHKIKYGDGSVQALEMARSAHSNAAEYIPITLILLFLLEQSGADGRLIHAAGIVFLIGRVLHAKAILGDQLKGRRLGMQITFFIIFFLAMLNAVYFFRAGRL